MEQNLDICNKQIKIQVNKWTNFIITMNSYIYTTRSASEKASILIELNTVKMAFNKNILHS